RRDMIFKAHQVWGHSQKLDYVPLPISVQKDQWRIVTGVPEWGMWNLDTWTVNPDTGALDLDGDLETDDDQYYVKSTHSFQENFTMIEEYLWVDIFWEPNGSLFNDEFHMSSYTGKVTFSWEHSWADNHIWYYADTGTVVDAAEWAQISDTLYDAWGNPKPGYWGISWMAENYTSSDLKQQALDEGWDWVEDDQTWSWLWWGLHEDYSTEVYNGTHNEIMNIDLDYEFAGVLAWNDTVAVDAATTNVMNFNSTYSELTHYWMPMNVEAVTFVTPGEAWGNMNQSDMEYRALNETIDFGVTFQNLTGVAFPYGENSYFDWYDGQYYGSDLSTFADRPTQCNTTELSLDVHFTGAENETGANSAEVKFDIAIGEWDVDTPDQDPLDGFSLAIAFYSELTVSTESGQSAAGGYVGDTGTSLNNTAAVPSENFTMTSGLSNVAMMSLGGAPYYWGSPEGGNVNVTAQTVPLSTFENMYVSDEGTSNAGTFNVTVEQFYTLISFRWWSGYAVEVDPVFVAYISPGASDTIAPSVSGVQSNPREISGVDNMHLEISAYDTGGSGMNEVKVWDQVNNVNYSATYVSGIDAYVVDVPRETGREEQYYFDYSIVANDGAGNELVASGYTFRFRDNIDPSIVLLDHTNGTDAFSNEIGLVEVEVSDAGGSGVSSVTLTYTNTTGSYNVTMTLSGTNYTAIIPNHAPDTFVSYQVTVYDADGNYVQSSSQFFHFSAEGPDVTGPSLLSLGRQPTGPTSNDVVTISVTVLDGTGVQSAILQYSVNSGAWVNITMSSAGNIYSANIPAQAAGAAVTYRIVAYDTLGNMAISSEQSYDVQTETTTTTEPTEPVEPVPGPRPQDLSSTYMMLAGIGLTMIVILVMVFQRKRRM
ncbi:MAG: hypothetical protein GQ580_03955, partial [Candidatus Thorarchaeota archaeon]|nr:hypothetical protein [Candidatus Thorarchaeota archaeon]